MGVYTHRMTIGCYLLVSEKNNRNYIGTSNDIKKRVRQHNGEISGGGKYTSMHKPWKLCLYVTGFTSQKNRYSFEWHWKQIGKKRKYIGLQGKWDALIILLKEEKWKKMSLKIFKFASVQIDTNRKN